MTVAVNVPADVAAKVHNAVDAPPADRATLEEHDAVSPDDAVTARLTGPESPERLVKVTVLLPDEPAVNEVDDAEML